MSNTFGQLKLASAIISSGAVKFDGSGDLIPCSAVSDDCVGIVQNAPNLNAGAYVVVAGFGFMPFTAEGTISAGDDLTLGTIAPGTLKAAVSTDKVVGKAMADAVSGELCDALIFANKTTVKA